MDDTREKPPALEYERPRQHRGMKYWADKAFWRLGKPMSLGMYYLITFVLSIIATILALIVAAIMHALR